MKKRKTITLIIAAALIVAAGAFFGVRAARNSSGSAVPILMYHSVCEDETKAGRYIVTDDVFRSDMEYLQRNGYTAVFVSDLIDYVYNGTPLPEKPVVISLDDGYLNNLTDVLPILRDTGMKAVVSVIGSGSENASANGGAAFAHLSWDEVRELSDSGYVEIANHTWNMHENAPDGRRGCKKMSGESTEEYRAALTEDISKLQSVLEEKTGKAPETFTYPYGKISPEAEAALKDMGFKAALTCKAGMNYLTGDPEQLFELHRFNRPTGLSTGLFMLRIK